MSKTEETQRGTRLFLLSALLLLLPLPGKEEGKEGRRKGALVLLLLAVDVTVFE